MEKWQSYNSLCIYDVKSLKEPYKSNDKIYLKCDDVIATARHRAYLTLDMFDFFQLQLSYSIFLYLVLK